VSLMSKTNDSTATGLDRRSASEVASLRWEVVVVGAATLVGLIIRLYRLAAAPLSSQEIYTWDFAHQSVPFIFGRLSHIETNPPFYYLMMKLVMNIGESEFLLRLPSVVAGTLAIPLIYILGRLGGASRSGVIGAGLVSLSAVAITYSREARTYALVQDACLLAAIGAVIIAQRYLSQAGDGSPSPRREILGWVLFTLASIVGFYLHYTFAFEILVLECAIAVAVALGWLAGTVRIDKPLIVKWLASSLLMALSVAWGFVLARSQGQSDNIAWMQVPSLRGAVSLLIHVDGYGALFRFQPLPSLLLIGLACVGLVAGWRRSAAVLVCAMLFALFPLILFVVSQSRPVFIERSLVAPSFAVCLLAGYGSLFLARKLSEYVSRALDRGRLGHGNRAAALRAIPSAAAVVVLFVPAMMSAVNSVRGGPVWEPYDRVSRYLASVVKPGDAAAGTDGIIYYRRRINAVFPYFKLVEGNSSEALVTYGSPTADSNNLTKLVRSDHSIYLVLRDSIGLVVDGRLHASYAGYVLDKLGHRRPPVASFGALSVYLLPGKCIESAPCL
jgi:4-amino-4-deoxy-L-arabinose transferase-like glycosyltransferase